LFGSFEFTSKAPATGPTAAAGEPIVIAMVADPPGGTSSDV
jgi:hypothetical protein